MVKGKYDLKTTLPDGIDTNGNTRRNGSGDITSLMTKLLPEAREAIYQYQDQFTETHGWTPNTALVVNELILLAKQMRAQVSENILPGYYPALYKENEALKKGDKFWLMGKSVKLEEILPGEKAKIKYSNGRTEIVFLSQLIKPE